MRSAFITVSFLVALFLRAEADDFWMPLNGPDLGQVYGIAEDNEGTLWATTHSALYRSDNDGHTWEVVRLEPSSPFRTVITRKGTIVFVSPQWVFIMRSEDEGK